MGLWGFCEYIFHSNWTQFLGGQSICDRQEDLNCFTTHTCCSFWDRWNRCNVFVHSCIGSCSDSRTWGTHSLVPELAPDPEFVACTASQEQLGMRRYLELGPWFRRGCWISSWWWGWNDLQHMGCVSFGRCYLNLLDFPIAMQRWDPADCLGIVDGFCRLDSMMSDWDRATS